MKEAKERIKQINIKIGNNLLKARLAAGMSREELCENLDVIQQQIAKYERGIDQVPIGRLVLIAEVLSIDLSSLLEGITSKKLPKV